MTDRKKKKKANAEEKYGHELDIQNLVLKNNPPKTNKKRHFSF